MSAGFWGLVWPEVEGLVVESVTVRGGRVRVDARCRLPAAVCPGCGAASTYVHSRYARRLADRPLGGRTLTIHLHARRFRCRNQTCAKATFAEQVPNLAVRYARRTTAAARVLCRVGLAAGGRPGARLLEGLDMTVDRTTVLRHVKTLPLPPIGPVKVLGVDEFAIRRGQTYATLLADVHTRRPVDLLPDRSADSFAAWLTERPSIEVICRDRSSLYSEGARRGAPAAIQVADRWHLLQNLTAAVERTAHAHRSCLRTAFNPADSKDTGPDETAESTPPEADPPNNQLVARTRARHADIAALLDAGHTRAAVARILNLDPRTVTRYAADDLNALVASARDRRRSPIDPYKAYLQDRFRVGCHNARQLHREIAARGYPGSHQAVRRYVATLRSGTADPEDRRDIPSPRQLTGWIMRSHGTLSDDERQRLHQALHACPDLAATRELADAFHTILRHRTGHTDLTGWTRRALETGPRPIQGFAAFLQNDWDAVIAGLSLPWNSGVVEGHVTRVIMWNLICQVVGCSRRSITRCEAVPGPR